MEKDKEINMYAIKQNDRLFISRNCLFITHTYTIFYKLRFAQLKI